MKWRKLCFCARDYARAADLDLIVGRLVLVSGPKLKCFITPFYLSRSIGFVLVSSELPHCQSARSPGIKVVGTLQLTFE